VATGYEAGSAYISVLPSLKGFQDKVDAQLRQIKAEVLVPIKPELDPAAKQKTKRDGEQAGGEFADAFTARVKLALKALPKAEITAESSDADRKIQEIRAQLEELSSKRVGVDISDTDALAKIAGLQAELSAIGSADSRVSVRVDTAVASAALDDLKTKIDRTLNPDTAPEGERAAGAWADAFKSRMSAALSALPDIEIHAQSSDADRTLADLRARLESLRDKRINVDITDHEALAQVAALESALADVGRKHPSTSVRADTADAMGKLAAFRADIEKLDGTTANVKADDGGSAATATQGMGALRLALLALAPAAIPIAAAVIPAIAGIGLASVAAVAGLGVLKLGLEGIGTAYSALQDAQTEGTEHASQNAQSIRDAEMGIQDARESAADGAVSAAERVQAAQQSLADAERTASEQVQTALEAQTRAEQSLADAQRQALRAQQALTDARRTASRNLQDLQLQSIQADLDQRSATLQLAQAQQALASANANPFAAPGQVAEAQLQLEQAQLAQQRAGVAKGRAGEDLVTAQAQGISGAPGVVSAQDSLTQAQQGVGNAQQEVADAARNVADAQIQAAEKVANAEQALTDAYRQQAIQARQGAESILRAQEALYSAENANAEAANKVNTAMAALSPAGQQFVLFLRSIKPELDSIGLAAQQALIPGIQAGIQALLPALPAIRDLVAQIAGGIGEMAKGLGQALAGPFWQDFFRTVGEQIVPALRTMGQIFGNLAEGGARIFVALLPLANQFGQAVLRMSERFVEWAKSPALAQFVDYVQRSFDVVGPLLSAIGDAVLQLLPPLAEWGLAILKALAPLVEKLLPPLVKIVSVVAGVFTAAWTELAGPIGDLADIIAGALTDAVGALEPLLPPMLDMFRTLVRDGVVPLINDGLRPLVQQALPPLLGLIPLFTPVIKSVGDAFKEILPPLVQVVTTLVQALVPIIKDLAPLAKPLIEAFSTLFDLYIKGTVVPILRDWLIPSLQMTADVLTWLVKNVVDPMMRAYAQYSQDAWDALKPIFDNINNSLDSMGKQFGDTVSIIGEAWAIMQKTVGTPVKAVIDLAYNDGLVPMWNQFAYLVNAPQLKKVDTSGIPHFAGGGVLPGYAPGHDVVPALLSPGEAVLVPGVVRALGASTILGLNATFGGRPSADVARYADGGIVGDVLALAGGASPGLTDPLATLKSAVGNDSPIVEALAKLPTIMLAKAADFLWSLFGSIGTTTVGGKAGAAGVALGDGQLDKWIAAAIAVAGVPVSWASGLHTLIMRESGGNPTAINLTDINAQRGDPSRGLAQTTGGTFAAYRDPRLPNDIYDPVANIVAAIRYIHARYGDISHVQQANPNLPPLGYDAGGLLPPGLSTVLNGTGQPEAILTSAQFSALAAAPSFPPDGWEITGALSVDGMDARIDGRINRAEQRTGTAIAQRSRL
jgi:phage-related protein